MLSQLLDDISNWTNYSPEPSPAEVQRTFDMVGDPARAQELLQFGFRPLSTLDDMPAARPRGAFDKPFEVTAADMSDENILVDISTGYRFRYMPEHASPVFCLTESFNYFDAQELLMLAASRQSRFRFDQYPQLTSINNLYTVNAKHVLPLQLRVHTRPELEALLDELAILFCQTCPARRLWVRGQQQEYFLQRSSDLCHKFYGVPRQASLLPSAGRYALQNPDKMGFALAFGGPNHYWKKPFLIWIMRENAAWFAHDPRALDLLSRVLADDDDLSFAKVLNALQTNSEFAGLAEDIEWPDEADDLRQWFFAFMKPHSFGITLQQYGYVTSLLDLTSDLDVALYFSQAGMVDGRMRKQSPKPGRLIYVFAERKTGDFFRHGKDLFWGDKAWVDRLPPRLDRQKAGFIMASTCRTQNFYGNMIVARIHLEGDRIETSLQDDDLFPTEETDVLYRTLRESRPVLEGLY